jgi:NADH-quinone oxidoreductase subunit C
MAQLIRVPAGRPASYSEPLQPPLRLIRNLANMGNELNQPDQPASDIAASPIDDSVTSAPVRKLRELTVPSDASAHPLVKRLFDQLPGALISAEAFLGQLAIRVNAALIVSVCTALHNDDETPFDYLCDLTCVHYPQRTGAPFEIVYNLTSIATNTRIRLKARVSTEIESVTGVWPAANWPEREVFDLFGIVFTGHPDLRRILLPKDWVGHPLRKEYQLEFTENEWTARHLPPRTDVQQEQLVQRRGYGLEALSSPDEHNARARIVSGKEVMQKDK